MQSREYQTEAENAVMDFLINETGNGILAMPGGCGKSYIMARLCKRILVEWPEARLMVLARDAKLLSQNKAELTNYWPSAPCGIYSAELKMRDTRSAIIFGGIQSIAKRANEFGKRHIIFVDEADQVSPTEKTQYDRFINDMRGVVPGLRVIGPTATAYRLGIGCLTNMDMWDKIIIDYTKTERFAMFIAEGHLCRLVNKKAAVEIDVTNVGMKCGEFNEKELQEASDTYTLNKAVVEECIRFGSDRKHWLVFASGVKHGHNLEKMFRSRGIPAAMVSSEPEMKKVVDRDKDGKPITYAQDCENKFRSGEIRALINVGIFGRGWNFRELDMIIWARATQSVALWVQGCVTGTRTAPGKTNALILDMAGNTRRIGPIDDPIVPQPRRKGQEVKGEAPVRECPQCFSYVHTRVTTCPDCGFIFPPPKTIEKKAANEEIMKRTAPVEPVVDEFKVLGVRYKPTVSKKGMEYLSVGYSIGTYTFNEAIFFQSGSMRHLKLWWEHRGGKLPLPQTPQEAADRSGELRTPSMIRVDVTPQNKYPKVLGCEFGETPDDVEDLEKIPF